MPRNAAQCVLANHCRKIFKRPVVPEPFLFFLHTLLIYFSMSIVAFTAEAVVFNAQIPISTDYNSG